MCQKINFFDTPSGILFPLWRNELELAREMEIDFREIVSCHLQHIV